MLYYFNYTRLLITYLLLTTTAGHALLAKAVGTTSSDGGLGHLELAGLATAELLDGAANAALLWRENVATALENLRLDVVTTRLGAVVKTTVGTTVELALATANGYERARLW